MRNKEKGQQKIFYVYVYLDTTKPGEYVYEGLDVSFLYEPFYVGKGNGDRYKRHLELRSGNKNKTNTIIKIIEETGKEPGIVKIKTNMNEEEAFTEEIHYITTIKRIVDGGHLTNVSIGGQGITGSGIIVHSKSHIFVSPKNVKIEIHNLEKFCKENNLNTMNMYHIQWGIGKSYKGYRKYTDETSLLPYKRVGNPNGKIYTFINPNGDKIIISNLTKFCRDNNLMPGCMMGVNKGRASHHKGWRRYVEGEMPVEVKTYTFISPEGIKVSTINLKQFCKDKNLNAHYMSDVNVGKHRQYKGWTKYIP